MIALIIAITLHRPLTRLCRPENLYPFPLPSLSSLIFCRYFPLRWSKIACIYPRLVDQTCVQATHRQRSMSVYSTYQIPLSKS